MTKDVGVLISAKDQLIRLCVRIYAHDALDWTIDLGANSYNAYDCTGVADEILRIYGMTYSQIEERVNNLAHILGHT